MHLQVNQKTCARFRIVLLWASCGHLQGGPSERLLLEFAAAALIFGTRGGNSGVKSMLGDFCFLALELESDLRCLRTMGL